MNRAYRGSPAELPLLLVSAGMIGPRELPLAGALGEFS